MEKQTGKFKREIESGVHRVEYSLPFVALVSLNGIPQGVLGPGTGKRVLRTYDTTLLELDVTDAKTNYGLSIVTKPSQKGEELDDVPPPPPPSPENFLALTQHRIRQEMGIFREEFTRGRSPHEIGEIDIFEEEEMSNFASQQKQAGTTEGNNGNAGPDAEGSQPTETSTDNTKETGNPG